MKYEELIKNHAGKMVDQLVTELFTQEAIEIKFDFEDNEQWSVVTVYQYEDDQEISLRLHPGNRYELYFGYYDDEDEFHDIRKDLTEEESDTITPTLKKAMAKVLNDEQGLRIPSHLLSR